MLPYYFLPIPLGLVAAFIYVVWDWRRHRAPLAAENPTNHYTFLHHLKVVTLPLFRYRISLVVSRSEQPSASAEIKADTTVNLEKKEQQSAPDPTQINGASDQPGR